VADIEDIYALRFLLEPEALRLVAASRPGRDRLAPLRSALDDMATAHDAGDGAAFMDANYRYRDAWTALVPNKRLVRAIQIYADHVRYLRAFTLDDASVRDGVLRRLKQLTAALAAGDGEAAAQAMRAHLESAKRILLEMTERR
jgi:DNA-binding GntR family transcriptional regulator